MVFIVAINVKGVKFSEDFSKTISSSMAEAMRDAVVESTKVGVAIREVTQVDHDDSDCDGNCEGCSNAVAFGVHKGIVQSSKEEEFLSKLEALMNEESVSQLKTKLGWGDDDEDSEDCSGDSSDAGHGDETL